jgi:hypothetical protein
LPMRLPPLWGRGQDSPLQRQHFLVLGDRNSGACGDPVVGLRRRNRLAVGYPPYVCRHVLAFLPNSFGFLTHRGGRDARVPVRRRFAANCCRLRRCRAFGFCQCVFRPAVFGLLRSPKT